MLANPSGYRSMARGVDKLRHPVSLVGVASLVALHSLLMGYSLESAVFQIPASIMITSTPGSIHRQSVALDEHHLKMPMHPNARFNCVSLIEFHTEKNLRLKLTLN
jgi:hypothetical protein